MNILVLTYEYPPIGGGAGRVVQALAEVWSARGNTVSILTSGEKGQTGIDLNESVRIIRVAAGRSSVFRSSPRQMVYWAWSAWQYLKKHPEPYQVVVANFLLPGGLLALQARQSKGWPYLILTHGHDVPGAAPEEMRYFHAALRPLLKKIGSNASAIVALNSQLRDLLVNFLPEKKTQIHLLPNGLDGVNVRERSPGQGEIRLVWAGRLVDQKRPEFVLRLLEESSFAFRLDIFGDGPLRKNIERRISVHPNKASIYLHGFVTRKNWLDYLDQADLLLHTARFEAMSLVQLEACSRGVFVVSSPVGGMDAWLIPGVNGQELPNDLNTWRNTLNLIYKKRFLPGYQYPADYTAQLSQRLSWTAIAEQYLELLQEMTNNT